MLMLLLPSCCCAGQVLPRYQNLASQLYDRLRVVSLDEVIPALDSSLAQAAL
jgi:hypothetical protein